jgi:hypothetical protein
MNTHYIKKTNNLFNYCFIRILYADDIVFLEDCIRKIFRRLYSAEIVFLGYCIYTGLYSILGDCILMRMYSWDIVFCRDCIFRILYSDILPRLYP